VADMHGWCWETLKENFETMYTQAFIIDSIITETENWFEDHNIINDYDPRMGNQYCCTFHIGSETYNWSMDMWNKNSLTNPGVSISIDQLGMLDPDKPHSQPILRYHFGFPHLKETPSPELHVDDDIFREYKEIIDKVFEDKKLIEELFTIRTNPGMPTTSTYVVDDILHKFNMELSWMKSEKYVTEKMLFDDLLKMDDQDLNYNKTIYRFANRTPDILARFFETVKERWMFGKTYRIENINLNGLFYIENMDLQDISECGYDTLENLIDEGYKVVEIVEGNEDGTSDKTSK
jgi:hypothetical protein